MFELSPLGAVCTSTTAVTQFTFLLSSGVHVQSGLRDSGTLLYILYFCLLLRLMVPRRGYGDGRVELLT